MTKRELTKIDEEEVSQCIYPNTLYGIRLEVIDGKISICEAYPECCTICKRTLLAKVQMEANIS